MTAAGVLLGTAFLAGAATQRLTGLGFAIVAAPIAVLAVGPWNAVGLLNAIGLALAGTLFYRLRREIDWKRVGSIGAAAACAAVPGTFLASAVARSPALQVGTGLLILISLIVVHRGARIRREGVGNRIGAGLISGAMNAVAGLAGPALLVYGKTSGWATRSFVASVQPIVVSIALATLAARWWVDGSGNVSPITAPEWATAAIGSAVGLAIGELLARRVKPVHVEAAMLAIASLAAAIAIVKGLTEWSAM